MIDLRVTAETPSDLHRDLLALLAGANTGQQLAGSEEAPKNPTPAATRGRDRKAQETGAGTQASGSTSQPASDTSGGSASADTAPSSEQSTPAATPTPTSGAGPTATTPAAPSPADTGPVTRDSISAKAMTLAQKAGPNALSELWSEFGITKFSELGEDKYAALNVRLDELLTPAA